MFEDKKFAGVIDFDLCAPGSLLWDLVYTAYRFVPLMTSFDDIDYEGERSPLTISTMRERLSALINAYTQNNDDFMII